MLDGGPACRVNQQNSHDGFPLRRKIGCDPGDARILTAFHQKTSFQGDLKSSSRPRSTTASIHWRQLDLPMQLSHEMNAEFVDVRSEGKSLQSAAFTERNWADTCHWHRTLTSLRFTVLMLPPTGILIFSSVTMVLFHDTNHPRLSSLLDNDEPGSKIFTLYVGQLYLLWKRLSC